MILGLILILLLATIAITVVFYLKWRQAERDRLFFQECGLKPDFIFLRVDQLQQYRDIGFEFNEVRPGVFKLKDEGREP